MASDHTLSVGEALVGEGNEIAHIDLMIGTKNGPVGVAFASALATRRPATATCWPSWSRTCRSSPRPS
jgi:formaldehyde-activating enzyme involved in methanogenesis